MKGKKLIKSGIKNKHYKSKIKKALLKIKLLEDKLAESRTIRKAELDWRRTLI